MDTPDNRDTTSGENEKPARTVTGVGELLRTERLAHGLSIEDVARQLRLAVRQVTALEEEDYDKLASGTFARGFVRNYAKLLQMDAAPLLQQLDQSLPPVAPQTITYQIEGVPFPSKQKHGSRNLVIAGVIILVLLLLIYEIYRGNEASIANITNIGMQPSVSSETGIGVEEEIEPLPLQSPDETPNGEGGGVSPAEESADETESAAQLPAPVPALVSSPAPATKAVSEAAVPEPPSAASPPSTSQSADAAVISPVASGGANGVRLIFTGESWTEVKDGRGRLLLSRINPRGTEHVLQGTPPFFLTIGNAAEVKLVYNSKPVDLAPYINAYGGTARLSLE
ncbi:MAG: RodZ domain-containing protein [Nitrosospira sp.]